MIKNKDNMKIKKFNELNNTNNIDPYGEEEWDVEAEENKRQLVIKCMDLIDSMDRDWQYGELIEVILKEYFEGKSIDQLEQFLNDYDEE